MSFGERLKELRLDKDITQKELGSIIGVSDRVVGYYESDDRFPRDEAVLRSIADYFNVSVDYLLGRTDVQNQILTEKERNADSSLLNKIDNLNDDSRKELEQYIQYLKIKETMDKSKNETSSTSEKNA